MNVLLLSDTAFEGDRARDILTLCRHLPTRGQQPCVAAPAGALAPALDGTPFIPLPTPDRSKLHFIRYAQRLLGVLRQHEIDVVLATSVRATSAAGLARTLGTTRPSIVALLDHVDGEGGHTGRTLERWCDALLVETRFERATIGLASPSKRSAIRVAPRGLEDGNATFVPAPRAAVPRLACNVDEVSDATLRVVLRAWSRAVNADVPGTLLLAGTDVTSRALPIGLSDAAADRLELADLAPGDAGLPVSLVVHPTTGLPRAVRSALLAGVPALLPDHPATRELAPEGWGATFVGAGDPYAMASAIVSLLGSPRKLAASGLSARSHARLTFNVRAWVDHVATAAHDVRLPADVVTAEATPRVISSGAAIR